MRRPSPFLPAVISSTLLLTTVACGDETGSAGDSGEPGSSEGTATYYADMVPVLAENCTRCHHPSGLGGADFTDPDTVVAWGDAILSAVEGGRMPPPVADPDCQEYEGFEHMTLDADELAVIQEWVADGKELGDPADEPEVEAVSGQLSDPDLVLSMPEPYVPTYIDEGNPSNEYRCFVVDPELDETKYITALAPIVDNEALVHHVVLFSAPESAVGEEYRGEEGFDCIDGMGSSSADSMIAAWAPGMLPIELPEGAGIALGSTDVLVFQMHYYANGQTEGESDQSAYAFELTDEVDQVVQVAPVGSSSFAIPAGDEAYTFEDSLVNEYVNLDLFGVFPHMHQLGVSYTNWIKHEDGSSTCLSQGEYDFDNQITYQFPEPIPFERGDTLHWSCTWNNSSSNPALEGAEPKDTYYGERTDEEMCFFFTLMAVSG